MNIRRLDLNLLIVLEALWSEGSVTRAAERLHVAQPTVSNALKRLRVYFGDPLLVRSGGGMRPTPRAKELIGPFRTALSHIERTVEGESAFVPTSSERVFRLATTDYVSLVLLPQLLDLLRQSAPSIRIAVTELNVAAPLEDLKSGDIDLVLGSLEPGRQDIHHSELFTDEYICLVRQSHPVIKRRVSLQQFANASHIAIRRQHGGTGGLLDDILGQQGLQRRIAIYLPHFASAPFVLLSSDLVLTTGARIGKLLQQNFPLQLLRHPVRLRPFVVYQMWHQRSDKEPGHQWLRQTVSAIAANPRAQRQHMSAPAGRTKRSLIRSHR